MNKLTCFSCDKIIEHGLVPVENGLIQLELASCKTCFQTLFIKPFEKK